MAITVERVFEEALCLSDESRVALAERLIESVVPDKSDFEAQVALAESRDAEMESGDVKGIPGGEALRQVREAILKKAQA